MSSVVKLQFNFVQLWIIQFVYIWGRVLVKTNFEFEKTVGRDLRYFKLQKLQNHQNFQFDSIRLLNPQEKSNLWDFIISIPTEPAIESDQQRDERISFPFNHSHFAVRREILKSTEIIQQHTQLKYNKQRAVRKLRLSLEREMSFKNLMDVTFKG